MNDDKIRRGRKRLACEIQRICPDVVKVEPQAPDEPIQNPPLRNLDSHLQRQLSERAGDPDGVTKADLFSLQVQIRREIKAVDERLSRQLEEMSRKVDSHLAMCGRGSGGVLPTATLPLNLPLPSHEEAPSPKYERPESGGGAWNGAASKVSPFSGNDSATSDGSSGSLPQQPLLSSSPMSSSPLSSSLPPLTSRAPPRRSASKEPSRPLVMSDYTKYVGDGSDPLVFPPAEEDDRWTKLRDAGTAPQLPTSYCWSMLRARLGVEGLVHPSLTKSEACPPNSSLKDLLRRQSNVIAQALALTLNRYSKPDSSEADTRQLARNIMRQVIKNVNTLRTSYKHIAMRQQMEEDVAKMDNVATAFQKLRQHYFTSQGFSLS